MNVVHIEAVEFAHAVSPSVDRVTPRKAGLPAQPAWQPLGEEPQHGALGRHAVPGHGNYPCVTTTATATTITTSPRGAALRPHDPPSWSLTDRERIQPPLL